MTAAWQCELDADGVVRLAELLALRLKVGSVVALRGELGAGKTTLARAVIRALTDDDTEVPSPTFSLQQAYATERLTVTHFDFYRLSNGREALELGLEDAIQHGAVIVEWPERVAALLQPREGKTPTLEELQAHCRNQIAGYKVPRELIIIDVVPRLPNGKPDYRRAKEQARARAATD